MSEMHLRIGLQGGPTAQLRTDSVQCPLQPAAGGDLSAAGCELAPRRTRAFIWPLWRLAKQRAAHSAPVTVPPPRTTEHGTPTPGNALQYHRLSALIDSIPQERDVSRNVPFRPILVSSRMLRPEFTSSSSFRPEAAIRLPISIRTRQPAFISDCV